MLEKKIVICDIDGTIANNDHRQHLLKKFKDWDNFFAQLHLDEPILVVIERIKDLKRDGKEIVFLTGRPERYRSSTKEWLSKYFNFKFKLEMRKDKDFRNKLDSKKDSLLVIGKENIFKIFENDYQLIQLWNSMGLDVEDVNYLID